MSELMVDMPRRPTLRPRGTKNPQRFEQMMEMRRRGMTLRAIGEHFGITVSTVSGQLNPDKKYARGAVSVRICSGTMQRPDHCERCGIKCKPDAHHPDYSKPLDVIFLCEACHYKDTNSTNTAKSDSHSGVKGIWIKHGKWVPHVKRHDKWMGIGTFKSLQDAIKAQQIAVAKGQ